MLKAAIFCSAVVILLIVSVNGGLQNNSLESTTSKQTLNVEEGISEGSNNDSDEGNVTDVRNNSTCGNPPEIEGALTPDLGETQHTVGTEVKYQCSLGYVSRNVGGFPSVCEIHKTTGKAEWTKPDISCSPRSCSDPGYVTNGRRIGNLFTFPNKIEFECEEGYKLKGVKSRYCQVNGEWSGRQLPTCELIYCSVPPDPVNGRVSYRSLEYGSELQYKCNRGFVLENHIARVCTGDGEWSNKEPNCIEVTCEQPLEPERGSVQFSNGFFAGSIATYLCEEGTTLVGVALSKCLENGIWTFDPPQCLRFCKIPEIGNGTIGLLITQKNRQESSQKFEKFQVDETVKHGSTVAVRCNEGFLPEGHGVSEGRTYEISCNDGVWSQLFQCRAAICLGDPPSMENGSPVVKKNSHGSVIWYRCKKGFEKVETGHVECDHGRWKGKTPVCARTGCRTNDLNYPGLEMPKAGYLESNRSFQINCEDGYKKISSESRIKCLKGKWKVGSNPCRINKCEEEPPAIQNGRIEPFDREHGSEIRYQCNEKFEMVKQSSVLCVDDRWEGNPPLCRRSGQLRSTTTMAPSSPPSSVDVDTCYCTYDYPEDLVKVHSENKPVDARSLIRRGGNVALGCKFQEMYLAWSNNLNFYGTANLTCDVCRNWSKSELPTCRTRRRGDSYLLFNNHMKILPDSKVQISDGKNISFNCVNFFDQPSWNPRDKIGTKLTKNSMANNEHYSEYLQINEAKHWHAGRYDCYYSKGSTVYQHTSLVLEIVAGEPFVSTTMAPSSTPPSVDSEKCYCTYDYPEDLITAHSRNKPVDAKTVIRKGETISLTCKFPGMQLSWSNDLNFYGSANLTCNTCINWLRSELPTCRAVEKADSYLLYNNDMKILPGGIVEIPRGKNISFHCINKFQQPSWIKGNRKVTNVARGDWNSFKINGYYSEYLKIEKAENRHAGMYDCYAFAVHQVYRSTTLKIKIVEPEIQCPELDRNTNRGIFDIHYDGDRKVHSAAIYTCKSSTQKVIGENRRSCREDGKWSGSYPSCEDITCPTIHTYNTLVVAFTDGSKVDSVATFRCDRNANLIGESSSICLSNGQWSNSIPTCQMLEIRCPVLNGKGIFSIYYSNDRRIGSSAQLHCIGEGLKVSGCGFKVCQKNGEWSGGDPICVENLSCDMFAEVENLEVHYSDKNKVGSIVTFSCVPPYKLVGSHQAKCLQNHTWNHALPSCETPKCSLESLTQSLPKEVSPNLQYVLEDFVPYGTELELFCEPNSVLFGSPKTKCGPKETWEHEDVSCIQACKLGEVASSLSVEPEQEHYLLGDMVTFSCPPGQKLSSEVQRIMCLGTSWSDPLPDCVKAPDSNVRSTRKAKKNN